MIYKTTNNIPINHVLNKKKHYQKKLSGVKFLEFIHVIYENIEQKNSFDTLTKSYTC